MECVQNMNRTLNPVIKTKKGTKMQELQVFQNVEFGNLGVTIINGKEYFQASDAARMLGYANPHKAIQDHCKNVSTRRTNDSLGRQQEMNFIPEGDLYRLIVKSKLPSAERFERWVFDEVLPTIRKHGAYFTPDVLERTLSDPNYIIGIISALAESKKELAMKDQVIGELKPKADYLDRILKSRSLVTITQIAKDYGMSGVAMNRLLHDKKVQYKLGDQWLLYSEYHDKGFTSSKTIVIEDVPGNEKVVMQTYWTMKGRLFLYNLLLEDGILPVIERSQNDAKQK